MIEISGKQLAQKLKDNIKDEILTNNYDVRLSVIQVGDNQASNVYVRNKENACKYCGISVETLHLPETITTDELLKEIHNLNASVHTNAILVQLPLPKHINEPQILQAIDPIKDVDGFSPVNVAKLWLNDSDAILPCTPKGIIKMIESVEPNIQGKNAVIIGRSNIVGKPVAKLLMDKGATVTICHSKTPLGMLYEYVYNADIVVVAIGKAKFLEHAAPGSIIIDVGINRDEDNKLCGDVNVKEVTWNETESGILRDLYKISPVPGGVGPMTIACLMENTLECYKKQYNLIKYENS